MGRDRVEYAWNRGFDAGCKLLPSDSNPYKSGGRLFEAWEDGWRNGKAPDPAWCQGAMEGDEQGRT